MIEAACIVGRFNMNRSWPGIRRYFGLAVLSAWLTAFALCPGARADADSAFTVKNVQVDVTAENVNVARDQAFANGQRAALTQVLQRFTPSAVWGALPQVSDDQLNDLILDIGVDQEKRSTVRYIATLSVRFKPDLIERLLRDANIPYAEWRGQPITILPVAQTESGPILWEAGNPWAAAWRGNAAQGLASVTVPNPPPANAGLPDAGLVASAASDTLAAYAQYLGSQDVLVAVAQPQRVGENQVSLQVTLAGVGPTASAITGTRSYNGDAGESIETLMEKAVADVMGSIDETYKSNNLLEFGKSSELAVSVPLTGLDDWVSLRRKLASATPVRSYDVTALSRTGASLNLRYVGEQKQLEAVFMQNGLVLSWAGDHWLLQNVAARPKSADATQGSATQ
jgi:hypothetical protein